MPFWERVSDRSRSSSSLAIVLAKLVDLAMRAAATSTPAPRRATASCGAAVMAVIIFVALLSGLLVIPQVRAVAGALLASGAVIGIIVGFASQRTLGNFVAGLLIAFTQPLRLGDRVIVDGVEGVVEEITLTYTFIRADDDTRLVVPNEKLASDTIRNATIVSRAQRAEITVQVPLSSDLETVIDLLRDEVARPSASPRCSSAASTATRRSRSARSPTIRPAPSGSSTTCACARTAACARPGSIA